MNPTVKINCKAAIEIALEDLIPLQRHLKQLTQANFEKLKGSIIKHGISFPIFIWKHEGQKFTIDGHQRHLVLRKMAGEGYQIPPLPCALIQAKDRKEAAEKILLISSQYGRMSEESLDEFLAENDLSFLNSRTSLNSHPSTKIISKTSLSRRAKMTRVA